MLYWVSDYTAHKKWPCLDYETALRWKAWLTYKGHDTELWTWNG